MATAKKATVAKQTATAKKATAATTAAAKKKTAQLKTVATTDSVAAFIAKQGAPRDAECEALVAIMQKATGAAPRMWGSAIVGFGDWHYEYESGREGDFFEVGFSPRKAALVVYISGGYEKPAELMAKLGTHSVAKGCLHIERLADVDTKVLAKLVAGGVAQLRARS